MCKWNVCQKLLIVAVVLLALLLSCCAQAEATGDYTYTVNEDGATATITGYTGTEAEVVIPSEIEGYPVTVIGQNAFQSHSSLISVVIPEGVHTTESGALSGCSSLTLVDCPQSLTNLQDYFWTDGEKLTLKVHYGSYAHQWVIDNMGTCLRVTGEIVDEASGCGYLVENGCAKVVSYSGAAKDVVVPVTPGGYSVTEIGDAAFVQRNTLTSVSLPDSVTHIGEARLAIAGRCRALICLQTCSLLVHMPPTTETSTWYRWTSRVLRSASITPGVKAL